jgi:hypothetical protein
VAVAVAVAEAVKVQVSTATRHTHAAEHTTCLLVRCPPLPSAANCCLCWLLLQWGCMCQAVQLYCPAVP